MTNATYRSSVWAGPLGGLDAYTRLLRHLPGDLGVAIVIVNHVRNVATLLHEILPKYTSMPVELITDQLLILPNRVFIIPEGRDLHVLDGEFRLEPVSKPRGWPDVITVFLRSLTQHWHGQLIAIIVSGYDGSCADIAVNRPIGHMNTKALQCRRAIARWRKHLYLFAFAPTSVLRARRFQPSHQRGLL